MRRAVVLVALAQLLAAAALVSAAPVSEAADYTVSIKDNFLVPPTLEIPVGASVRWTNSGANHHTVTSDEGLFSSGLLETGDSFTRTFHEEGFFYYHCKQHGSPQIGMWGLVKVGDPEPPAANQRPTIRVPQDRRTIQRAVDVAKAGYRIKVAAGTYRGSVVVDVPDLLIAGADRFRTVITGSGVRTHGIAADGVEGLAVAHLTIRRFTGAGVHVTDSQGVTLRSLDLIRNDTNGAAVAASSDVLMRDVFAYGSGDSGIRIQGCAACSALVDDVVAKRNYAGILLEDVSGAVIRGSRLVRNGVGLLSMGGRGLRVISNEVRRNSYDSVPGAGISLTWGLPFGTGVWLAGQGAARVDLNTIAESRYGILATRSFDDAIETSDVVIDGNVVGGPSGAALAWDGYGEDVCASGNALGLPTLPAGFESVYGCELRPFSGTVEDSVVQDVAAALADTTREESPPPEPNRPPCEPLSC